jgi:hypothetical protein
MPQDPQFDRKCLFDYLLGRMPEVDQNGLESRIFQDEETFAALEAAEDDLIDLYVLGRLEEADRQRVESYYLQVGDTAGKQRKVAFARRLRTVVDAQAPVAAAVAQAADPWWKRWFAAEPWFSMPRLALAGAACAVIAVGWFTFSAMRNLPAERQRQESAAVPVKPAPEVERPQRPADTKRADSPVAPQLVAKAAIPQPVWELNPVLERSSASGKALRLGGSTSARIRLRLESGSAAEWSSFSAAIETPEGASVWKSGSGIRGVGNAVEAIVPAAALKPGEYILRLSGRHRAAETEESIADYALQIVP